MFENKIDSNLLGNTACDRYKPIVYKPSRKATLRSRIKKIEK